ncbi:MAG: hypothetical protein U1E77_18815 [Inhella sp.]
MTTAPSRLTRRHTLLSFLAPVALGLSACSSVPLQAELPAELAGAMALEVSGRQGWLPDRQPLRFGDFHTSSRAARTELQRHPCPQGCSRFDIGVLNARFESRREQARQSLRFLQQAPGVAPLAVSGFQAQERELREWTWQLFGARLRGTQGREVETPFTATLQPEGAAPAWRVVLGDAPLLVGPLPPQLGWAESEDGQRIELRALFGRAQPAGSGPQRLALGYVLESEGRALAAVAVQGLGQGRVWLAPELSAERRQLAAALSTLLLLRPNPASAV